MQTILATACVLALTLSAAAQNAPTWKPVPGHIMTKWAADVSPDNVWPEYPRPQMVRDKWLNLNGLWNYSLTAPTKSESGRILVPFPIESALSGVGRAVTPDMTLTYTRDFTIPKDWSGQRVLLHFGAVDWKAVVAVNGKAIGTHTGGYDPFTFDITGALKPGDNTITVEVTDPTDQSEHPIGKQRLHPESIWYTPTTGIWQTVWLEPVPPVHIEAVDVQAISAGKDRGTVLFRIDNSSLGKNDGVDCTVTITEPGGLIQTTRQKLRQDVNLTPTVTAHVREPRLWSPDSPTLYEVKIQLGSGDSVSTYFAFREIKVAKDDAGINRLMLNGKPLFQFGPLDQGFWPDGLYTPPTDEAMKEDILAVKKMGGNMLRKHVKVEPDRFYYWCDKLGILVWQDMPSSFPKKDAAPDWHENFEDELQRMMAALKGHPCIVMWVPFNEGWGQGDHDWAKSVVEKVKQWDPTRLVDNASGWTDLHNGDVSDMHNYPGPGMPPVEPSRACVLGEFGGLGLPLEGHTWVNNHNWGYVSYKNPQELTDAYVDLIDRIPVLIAQGLCAAVYTQTTDVEVECNGWMTYDRAIWKIDPARAAAATKKLYEPPPRLTIVLPTAQQGRQLWRYSTGKPDAAWTKTSFDDSSWKQGPASFGTDGTPGAVVGTQWNGADIWLRRTFELPQGAKDPHLIIHHDEDAEVYINGTLAASVKGYTTAYVLEPLSKEAQALLKPGANTIAVHCHQTQGGQNIDVGLVSLERR